jgi:hypothetical protein
LLFYKTRHYKQDTTNNNRQREALAENFSKPPAKLASNRNDRHHRHNYFIYKGLSILLVKNSFTASNTSTKTRPKVNESYFARACLKQVLASGCKNDSRLKESITVAHTSYMEKRFD